MEFIKFFDSKKRELSSQSENGEDPKRLCTDVDTFLDDSVNDDIFAEGLQSAQFVKMLIKCLRNLENKVQDLCCFASSAKESQIKGDGHFTDLKKSVDTIVTQFEEYEKDRQEKEAEINSLKEKVDSVTKQNEELERQLVDQEKRLDEQEQYTRRNCLLIHGVEEKNNEDTDQVSLDIFNKDLNLEVSQTDLDRSHRLGKPRASGGKPRPIIVKFSHYNVRNSVFKNKKKLKGKGVAITESLTKKRMDALTKAKDEHGFNNVWTLDGKIFYKQAGANPKLYDF